jgi:hypothetical protein
LQSSHKVELTTLEEQHQNQITLIKEHHQQQITEFQQQIDTVAVNIHSSTRLDPIKGLFLRREKR